MFLVLLSAHFERLSQIVWVISTKNSDIEKKQNLDKRQKNMFNVNKVIVRTKNITYGMSMDLFFRFQFQIQNGQNNKMQFITKAFLNFILSARISNIPFITEQINFKFYNYYKSDMKISTCVHITLLTSGSSSWFRRQNVNAIRHMCGDGVFLTILSTLFKVKNSDSNKSILVQF